MNTRVRRSVCLAGLCAMAAGAVVLVSKHRRMPDPEAAAPLAAPHAHPGAAEAASARPAPTPTPPPTPTAAAAAERAIPTMPPAPPVPDAVAHFADPAAPVSLRLRELAELAHAATPESVATLMAVGDAETYLNEAAVNALGAVKTPAVENYLRAKLAHPDARVVCAAVRGLAAVAGPSAIEALVAVLQANRTRPDGHHDDVCAACVDALGALRSPRATPVLRRELEETVGVTLRHEYGSHVVQALRLTNDPDAQPLLAAYAERLARERDAMADNPMGRHYLQEKIDEALAAAADVSAAADAARDGTEALP